MSDWLNIAARFVLYIDLMLLFGLPLFALYNFKSERHLAKAALKLDSLLVGATGIGVLLSVFSMAQLAKSISGVSSFAELKLQIFETIITSTDVGLAWAARTAALLLIMIFLRRLRHWRLASLNVTVALAAIALASLAWAGHGAMNEGTREYLHLTSDILHLLAAGAWLGALAAFALLLKASTHAPYDRMLLLSHGLSGFAIVGTIIVITLAMTGVVNYWLIVGPTPAGLVSSTYGVLLLIKLGLFAAMLGLAAANRYHLSPLLKQAIRRGDPAAAVVSLRKSLIFETSAAVLIVMLVAWLGTLDPVEPM